jgi:predicted dehydrogenase
MNKLKVLGASADVTLVGVYEPDEQLRARALRERPFYRSVRWLEAEDVFGNSDLDGVFVETVPAECLPWALRAVEDGLNVLIDKAPGVSLEELRAVFDAADRRGVHVQIAYQFRYNTGAERALEIVRSGFLGDVFNIQAQLPTTLAGYTDRSPEAGRYPGGTFFELASHLVDLVVIFLGRPKWVTSVLRRDCVEAGKQAYVDNTVAVFEYERAMAVIQSWAMEVGDSPLRTTRRLEVYGTKGTIRLDPIEPPALSVCFSERVGEYSPGWQTLEVDNRQRDEGDVEEFVAVLWGVRKPLYDREHDLNVHAVLLEACGVGP